MQKLIFGVRKAAAAFVVATLVAGPLMTAMPMIAFADTTAEIYPTTVVNDTSVGSRSWASTANVTAEDGTVSASQTLSSGQPISNYLRASGFNFASIPSDATINGVTVTVKRKGSSATLKDYEIRLASTAVGTTTSKADTVTGWTTSLTSVNYGGAADMWGVAWTPAALQSSSFKVLFAAQHNSGGSAQAQVDSIKVTVTYTPAVLPPADTTAPVLTQITAPAPLSNDNTPEYVFSSDEAGTVTYGGACSNGSLPSVTSGVSTTTYSVSDNTYTDCTVQVTDAALNASNILTIPTFTVDTDGPAVVLSTGVAMPTSASSVAVVATFTEAVTGFDATDITVGNGMVDDFTPVSPTVYNFNIEGMIDGAGTVDVGSDVAFDAATNGNDSATTLNLMFDATAPVVVINSPTEGEYVASADVTFDFDVTGASVIECAVDGGTFVSCSGGSSSHATAGLSDATHEFEVKAIDDAFNEFIATVNFIVDTEAPTVEITSAATSPTNASSTAITVEFSEDVTDFDETDLDLLPLGTTVENFATTTTPGMFTFDLVPAAEGEVTVDIAAGAADDLAGNDNEAADQFVIVYDFTAPGLVIDSGPADASTVLPSATDFTFTGTDAVTSDLVVECSIDGAAFAGCDSDTAHALPGLLDGSHTFAVRATDEAGNVTTLPTVTFTVDGSAPTLAEVAAVSPSPTDDLTPDYTFNTTEAGTITYFGDCPSSMVSAVSGDNTITFDTLSGGVHESCSLTVTDNLGNESAPLAISIFDVNFPSTGGGGGGGSNNDDDEDGEVAGVNTAPTNPVDFFNNIFGGGDQGGNQGGEVAGAQADLGGGDEDEETPGEIAGTTTPDTETNDLIAGALEALGEGANAWYLLLILLLLAGGGYGSWMAYMNFKNSQG